MEKKTKLFESYLVFSDGKKVIVKAKLAYKGLEKFGYFIIYLIPLLVIWYAPPNSINMPLFLIILKIFLMIAALIIVIPGIKQLLSKTILVLDKEKNTLKLDLDHEELAISDIKGIEITEINSPESEDTYYQLKFVLPGGEKTSSFALLKYTHAKEIADVILPTSQQSERPKFKRLISEKLMWLILLICILTIFVSAVTYRNPKKTKSPTPLNTYPSAISPSSYALSTSPTLSDPSIADWRMYVNSERLYSFRYPPDWYVDKNDGKHMMNKDINETVYLRQNTKPCYHPCSNFETAQEIQISSYTIDTTTIRTLKGFVNSKFGVSITTPITINNIQGLRVDNISGKYYYDREDIFIKNSNYIYQVAWIKMPATKEITEEMFNKILSTFRFTEPQPSQ
jgi:hypothetical protein